LVARFPQLNPKDTLSWVRKDTGKRKTFGAVGTGIASGGKRHSFRHLSKSKITSVGKNFLKQDYSPITFPSSETGVQHATVFTD
jgi:hypothetical protein